MSDTETKKPENETETPEKSGGEENAPVTMERVVDTALGALVSAAEALEAAAKLLNEQGPAVAEAWEKKGRPVRERIIEALRGTPFAAPTSSGSPDAGGATSGRATEEISALERRVRELEQQIAAGDLKIEETTAEAATFNAEIWETPEERDSLADSPHAVSETPEEQAKESEHDSGNDGEKPKARSRKKPVE